MKFQDSSFNGLKVTVGTKKCDTRKTPKVGGIIEGSNMIFHSFTFARSRRKC